MQEKIFFWYVFIIIEFVLIYLISQSLQNNIFIITSLFFSLILSFYVSYDLSKTIFLFGNYKNKKIKPSKKPKVAVVYTTFNEFFKDALKSALNLNYKNYNIYILDDSTNKKIIKKIDKFAKKHKIKVIRRKQRKGFKAGAINNALKKIKSDFLLILDSDSTLKKDFIQNALKYDSKKTGFIQGKIKNNKKVKLAALLGDAVGFIYDLMKIPSRNILFSGHNGLIKTSVLKKIKGFPETTRAEDYALSLKMFNNGYKGVYAPDALSGEDIPKDYKNMKERDISWAFGTTSIIFSNIKQLLNSKISFFDKMDIFLDLTGEYFLKSVIIFSIVISSVFSIINNVKIPLIVSLVFLIEFLRPHMIILYTKNKKIKNYFAYIFTRFSLLFARCIGTIKAVLRTEKTFSVTEKNPNKNRIKSILNVTPEIITGIILLLLLFILNVFNLPIFLFSMSLVLTINWSQY